MDTQVVEAGPFERMLTLTLAEPELDAAKTTVARKLSRELKIKGFRPGKAPRAVVERMVGAERLRGEAIDEALPEAVGRAIAEAELAPVTTPRVEAVRDGEDGSVEVDVRVTLWPTLETVPDYSDREVIVAVDPVTDEELAEQLDRFRGQFAELDEVDRAADEGDFVMINISASAGGTEIEEATASDLLYEIGSRSFIPGLDELLMAASAGDIRQGPATLPDGFGEHAGAEVSLRVLVKGVRAKRLPEVDDEWVSDVSEFDSVEELEAAIRENIQSVKLDMARRSLRDDLIADLLNDLDVDLPDALVQAEMESSLHNLHHALEGQGLDLATYLQVTGQEQEQFADGLREDATRAISTRLLLDAVAEAEGLEVSAEEIIGAVEALAAQSGRPSEEVRSALAASGQEQSLAGDILRRKALDRLLERARAVDPDGNEIELWPTLVADEGDGEAGDDEAPPSEASDED